MEDTTKDLDNKCPRCNNKLYAFYYENVSGDKCTGTWNVECTICVYEPEEHCFADIKHLSEYFYVL